MESTGWASGVNQIIYDDTSISVGNGGTVSDSNANGYENVRLTAFNVGKTYQVVMYFDFCGSGDHKQVDETGLTEFEKFERWYLFNHKKGSIPFWFPSITKQSTDILDAKMTSGMTLYKIKGAYNASKSGLDMKVSMTFEEVYSGVINIADEDEAGTFESGTLSADLIHIQVKYTKAPMILPSNDRISIKAIVDDEWKNLSISKVELKGSVLKVGFTPNLKTLLMLQFQRL